VSKAGITTIGRIDIDSLPPFPDHFYLYPWDYNITIITHLGYSIFSNCTSPSGTIQIPYNEADVRFSEKNLRLFVLNNYNLWENITYRIDLENNTISGWSTFFYRHYHIIIEILDDRYPFTSICVNGSTLPWHDTAYSPTPVVISWQTLNELTGFQELFYSLNGINWTSVTEPFIIANQCDLDIYYYSVDLVGNEEPVRSFRLVIDWIPPATTYSFEESIIRNGLLYVKSLSNLFLITTDNTDDNPRQYYRIDGGDTERYHDQIRLWYLTYGPHLLEFYAVDCSGNAGPVQSLTFILVSSQQYNLKYHQPFFITLGITIGLIGLAVVVLIILVKKYR
jgi:hypothetical protein